MTQRAAQPEQQPAPATAQPLVSSGSMARRDNASILFIDTSARRDKRPYFETNAVTGGCKAFLLLATLALVRRLLYGGVGRQQKLVLERQGKADSRDDGAATSRSRRPRDGTSAAAALAPNDRIRRAVAMSCSTVYVTRVLVQMLLFWHRRIGWAEVRSSSSTTTTTRPAPPVFPPQR